MHAMGDASRFQRPLAQAALDGLATPELVKRALADAQSSGPQAAETTGRLLHAVGPAVIDAIVERWSAERDSRVRKILQEIVTLSVFVPVSLLVLGEPVKLNYVYAAICMGAAAWFVFSDGFSAVP